MSSGSKVDKNANGELVQTQTQTQTSSEKTMKCIKEAGNWSKLAKEHTFDRPEFDPAAVNRDMEARSPKLVRLLSKIQELDEADMKAHGHLFKHFIYSDIKSGYGAKLIASGLAAGGWNHAYELKRGARGMGFKMKALGASLNGSVGTFATLTSVSFFEKPIGINFRKELLRTFNSRPDNIYGDKVRIIILDSGFREGIDLFDIKYVHLFEPIGTVADQKQAIGRATRFCGQRGLRFSSVRGWPLGVYRYETTIPKGIRQFILESAPALAPSNDFFSLFMKFSNIDPKKMAFANELERVAIQGAADRELTTGVHNFKVVEQENMYLGRLFKGLGGGGRGCGCGQGGGSGAAAAVATEVKAKYSKYAWPAAKIENGCASGLPAPVAGRGGIALPFSPTQEFVRHFFTPTSPRHGMMLFHSVGTGKTCTAIATASSSFEAAGYTILYVTRHTLKGEVWKNMFEQSCSVPVQAHLEAGKAIPQGAAARGRLISSGWHQPISYKQFSNMLLGKNSLYAELVKINGKADPLRRTLVIIDEAHKLYAADVSGSEKPDVPAMKRMIQGSYEKSGADGVRLLLMTGTPYTDDPMDMIRLLNLMRKEGDALPAESFDAFAAEYLDSDGAFTSVGRARFLDDIAGYISYLNREKDIRTFAYPVITNVRVPMSNYEFIGRVNEYIDNMYGIEQVRQNITYDKHNIAQEMIVVREVAQLFYKRMVELHKQGLTKCYDEVKKAEADAINAIKAQFAKLREGCVDSSVACIADAKERSAAGLVDLKESLAAGSTLCRQTHKGAAAAVARAECLTAEKARGVAAKEDIKEELRFNIIECKKAVAAASGDLATCKETYKKLEKKELELAKRPDAVKARAIANGVGLCDQQKVVLDAKAATDLVDMKKSIAEAELALTAAVKVKEAEMVSRLADSKRISKEITEEAKKDGSQRGALDKCIGHLTGGPGYKGAMKYRKGKDMIEMASSARTASPSSISVADARSVGEVADKVYIISGHGSEQIHKFERRYTMPSDKILVTFAVCARPNFMDTACKFFEVFSDPRYTEMLKNPIENKARITQLLGRPIHIYLPGERTPELNSNLFLNFEKRESVIAKSGVYAVPHLPGFNRAKMPVPHGASGLSYCTSFVGTVPNGYTPGLHKEVYRGNIYKPLNRPRVYGQLAMSNYSLKTVMNDVGAGVYYYIGCRVAEGEVRPASIASVLKKSEAQQMAPGREEVAEAAVELIKAAKGFKKSASMAVPGEEGEEQEAQEKREQAIKEAEEEDKKKASKKIKPPSMIDGKIVFQKKHMKMVNENTAKLRALTNDFLADTVSSEVLLGEIEKIRSELTAYDYTTYGMPWDFREFEYIINNPMNYKAKLTVKSQLDHTAFIEEWIYTIPGVAKPVSYNKRTIGMVKNGQKFADVRCSTNTLVPDLKKLYKTSRPQFLAVGLPQTLEDERSRGDEGFIAACAKVRELMKLKKV